MISILVGIASSQFVLAFSILVSNFTQISMLVDSSLNSLWYHLLPLVRLSTTLFSYGTSIRGLKSAFDVKLTEVLYISHDSYVHITGAKAYNIICVGGGDTWVVSRKRELLVISGDGGPTNVTGQVLV